VVSLLLDSHVVLWWLTNDARLGPTARAAIRDARNVWVSAVTTWELEIKQARGRLELPGDLIARIEAAGFTWLTVSATHGVRAGRLPAHHRDPFDRMLIAQAQDAQLTIVTADRALKDYDVTIIDGGS
jgi:PIN domain nuclease of toxin-antitoxin system